MPQALTPDARAWQEKLDALEPDELTRSRATAKEWTGSISAITSLLAIVSLIKGRENIEDLTSGWSNAVYIALTAALLFALVAIVLGAVAAQGSLAMLGKQPGAWRNFWAQEADAEPGPYSLNWQGLRTFSHMEAKIVSAQMTWSRVAAVVAALLLIFAVSATWFAPTDKTATPVTVLVVKGDGSFVCGDLAKSTAAEKVAVVEKKGKPATEVPVAEILTVSSATSCP